MAILRRSYQQLVLIALFVAFISVCAIVSLPIGPIPFTLLTFAITLCAYLLTPKNSTLAFGVYLALGCLGLPIFSSFHGGLGVLLGPTGGFLIGYALSIYPITLAISKVSVKSKKLEFMFKLILGFLLTIVAYIFGCLQYMIVSNVSIEIALISTIFPFVIPDILKILCALLISQIILKRSEIFNLQAH